MKTTSFSSDAKEPIPPRPSSPGRSSTGPKHNNVNRAGATQGTNVTVRSNIGSSNSKSSSPSKPLNSGTIGASPGRTVTPSVSTNGSPQSASLASRQVSPGPASSANQRSPAPAVVSRLIGGSSSTESHPIRIQPLFKSASVLSTNQQVRNLKTSTNSCNVNNSGSISSSSSSGNLNSGNGGVAPEALPRGTTSSNQPVTKPQVPAKPAQLLDQQRNSFN